MAALNGRSLSSRTRVWTVATWIFFFCAQVLAQDKTRWITYTTDEGTIYLDDDRRPALYTGDFGNCEGDSFIDITRFDASLYKDNMTVMFHMGGTTQLIDEHVMIYAYGENRFNLTFNPCEIGCPTLCPVNASVPVEANGLIPIGPSDLAGIPSLAFTIPDFEGQAIIRLFSNATQQQIACYSAVMKNGNSLSQPAAVGSILGAFTAVAFVSSLATTIYGQFVPETRNHYAHSMSVFVVFSVLQHIFFTGSLSMNWPSVLVAFWSNYAWSAGMIHSSSMQKSISKFIGNDMGNISLIGSAPTNQDTPDLGGGFSPSSIYRRHTESLSPSFEALQSTKHMLQQRDLVNSSSGFLWYGDRVATGLPLPGNYSGFAGTLSELDIPASDAFLTALLWLLILVALVAITIISAKVVIEILTRSNLIKTDQLEFFRQHWIRFTGAAVLRTFFIAFFMMTYLAIFQFVLGGGNGVIAIAAVVLVLFVVGMFGVATYAIRYQLHHSSFQFETDKIQIVSGRRRFLNWYGVTRESSEKAKDINLRVVKSIPWLRPGFADSQEMLHVHDDGDYTTRFGWLASRFRRSRWWFSSVWLFYELIRACFYGGAATHPLIQVFGLLAWEIIAFIAIIVIRPFESSRLNLVMVYFLGFSKVATVGLSSAFDPRFGLDRIMTTVIGMVIVVIQGVLTVCLMIAIVLGAISSYISMTRNQQVMKPKSWTNIRIRYFDHISYKATDKPRPAPPPPPPEPEKPKGPYFSVGSIRRELKIEDEDPDAGVVEEIHEFEDKRDQVPNNNPYLSRNSSMRSIGSNLPYGARAHRRSWSLRDLPNPDPEPVSSVLNSRMSIDNIREAPIRYRASSMRELSQPDFAAINAVATETDRHRRTRSTSTAMGGSSHRHRRSRRNTREVNHTELRTEHSNLQLSE